MYRGARAASPQRRTPSPPRRGRPSRRGSAGLAQALLAAALLLLALRALLRPPAPAYDALPAAPLPVRCYVGRSDDGGALATQPLPAGHVCASYRLRCSAADAARGACSEEEAAAAHTRHVYAALPAAECEQLAQAAAYHHGRYAEVQCCDDAPLCNGGGGHAERAGGEAAGRVVRCAAGPRGAITAVVPADGGRCVRYGAPCTAEDARCSAADVAAGALRAVLGSASAEACAAYAKAPRAHVQLLCCAQDMCNDGRAGGFGAPGVPPATGAVRRAGRGGVADNED